MPLSVADVLELPVVATGRPRVRVGGAALAAPVRWAHISELTEVAGLLHGGELVFSTGMRLTHDDVDAPGYLRSLHEVGAVGLVVELGVGVTELPERLVAAARSLRFPLVELARSVRFVAITEAVHGRLLHDQHDQLRFGQRVNEAFAGLSVGPASRDDVLARASALLGRVVVLEDLAHRAVSIAGVTMGDSAEAGGTEAGHALQDWSARSRRLPSGVGTRSGGPEGWSVAPVGPTGQRWGRLVVPEAAADGERVQLVLERAAETLTIQRLIARDGRSLAHRASSALLRDLLGADPHQERALGVRARALGLPLPSILLPIAIHHGDLAAAGPGGEEAATHHVGRSLRRCGLTGLHGSLQPGITGVLLALSDESAAERAAVALARAMTVPPPGPQPPHAAPTTAVGAVATSLAAAGEGLLEACHVAEVVAGVSGHDPHVVHRRSDLGIRGLLSRWCSHASLAEYVEDQLGSVLRDTARGDDDLQLLRDHLASGGSMTRLARTTGANRPGLYVRVQRLAARLGRDLSDPEVRTSLHVALLAHDAHVRAATPTTAVAGGMRQRAAVAPDRV